MSLALTGSVGSGGTNAPDDVRAVQAALQDASRYALDPRMHPGIADGFSGVGTEGAIAHFQRTRGLLRPDARVDPGGYTAARLAALLRIGAALDAEDITFPFAKSSRYPFVGAGAGMRAFAARRSGNRAHAGIDVYQPDYTPVLAVADGVVTRAPYPFYLRTWAVEVDHGWGVVRYGEIHPAKVEGLDTGAKVERGQMVGVVGVLTEANGRRLRVPSMMLHFELYDKTAEGKLTQNAARDGFTGRPFQRRRDLIDPSGIMRLAPLPQ